ncbi:MAG TPA: glutamate synthase, partial [Deltaproteobacteria bacterium]|nr:glutamate synthase [Deltaproteobacteria bacterium]
NTRFSVDADLVFLALGFLGPSLEGPLQELNLEMEIRGKHETIQVEKLQQLLKSGQPMYQVRADPNFMTSCDGVFVAGDAKRGASLVVWAIWEGREAARCIDSYLMGESSLPTSPQAEMLA